MRIQIPIEQTNIVLDQFTSNPTMIKLGLIKSNSKSSASTTINEREKKRCCYRFLQSQFSNSDNSQVQQNNTLKMKQNTNNKMCGIRYLNNSLCQSSQNPEKVQPSILLNSDYYLNNASTYFVNPNSEVKMTEEDVKISMNCFKDSFLKSCDFQDNKNNSMQMENEEIQFSHTSMIQSQDDFMNEKQNDDVKNHIPIINKSKKISKTKEKKQNLMKDDGFQKLTDEYKSIKDQNSLKNIKDAFIRHINSNISNELKDIYVQRMGGNLQFGHIKKKINFGLKDNQTNNKCIKFMCKSSQVSPIFLYFLENIQEFWLNESKVQSKEACQQIAVFLIKIIKNIQFIDLIEHYHTKV